MSDRLTQLQDCLNQLLNQFIASLVYVDRNHDNVPAENEAKVAKKDAEVPSPAKFQQDIGELSNDLILKTRQIMTLIDSLPGANVTPQQQVDRINQLQQQLRECEQLEIDKIKEKDALLQWCDQLICDFSTDVIRSRASHSS